MFEILNSSNKGDKFIKKYERLESLKESRDEKVNQLRTVKNHRPSSVEIFKGHFGGTVDIPLSWEAKKKMQSFLIKQLEEEIKNLNKQMNKQQEKLCEHNNE